MRKIITILIVLFCLYPLMVKPFSSDDNGPYKGYFIATVQKVKDKTERMPMNGILEHDFSKVMVLYLQSGIEMCERYEKNGGNEALKDLARKIMSRQKEEKEKLEKFMDENRVGGSSEKHRKTLLKALKRALRRMEKLKAGANADKEFAELMIIYQRSGKWLSKLPYSKGDTNKLKQMGKEMIDAREEDLKSLKRTA
jgi:uncharacterized protein (DUF305 family)